MKEYGVGAQILIDLGIKKITLLTKSRKNIVGIDGFGLEVNGTKNSKNILIIIADFYDEISSNLKNGATNYLNKIKYSYDIKYVPGTLEIPLY